MAYHDRVDCSKESFKQHVTITLTRLLLNVRFSSFLKNRKVASCPMLLPIEFSLHGRSIMCDIRVMAAQDTRTEPAITNCESRNLPVIAQYGYINNLTACKVGN